MSQYTSAPVGATISPVRAQFNDTLLALLDATGEALPLDVNESDVEAADMSSVERIIAEAGHEPVYLRPTTANGIATFLYVVVEHASADAWEDQRVTPSWSLHKGTTAIYVHRLAAPVSATDRQFRKVAAAMGCDVSYPVPMPDANGWNLVHADAGAVVTLDTLAGLFKVAQTTATTAEHVTGLGWFEDAVIVTPIDWDAPVMSKALTLTRGKNERATDWTPFETTSEQGLKLFCRHREMPGKSNACIVAGKLPKGARGASAVQSVELLVYDFDKGTSGEFLRRVMTEAGLIGVLVSTHSHLNSQTTKSLDDVVKLARKANLGEIVTDEVARAWMVAEGYDVRIAESATARVRQGGKAGREVVITHLPVEKWRLVILLAAPYVIADNGPTDREARDRWRLIYQAAAQNLGGLPIDRTGADANRPFFLPSHPPGARFECYLFGGEPFDWRTVETDTHGGDTTAKLSGAKSSTEAGRALGRKYRHVAESFQIADVVRDYCDQEIRGSRSGGKLTVTCPFDAHHTKAGDPADGGFYVQNAGDGVSDIFTAKCSHDSCADRSCWDMAAEMVRLNWLPEAAFSDPNYVGEEAAMNVAEAAPQSPADRQTALLTILAGIEAMGVADVVSRDRITGEIAVLTAETDREAAIKSLAKKAALSVRAVRAEVTERLPKPKASPVAQGGLITQPSGHMVFTFMGDDPDQVDLKAAITTAITRENDPHPLWVSSFGDLFKFTKDQRGRASYQEVRPAAFHAEVTQRISVARVSDKGQKLIRKAPPREQIGDVYETITRELPDMPSMLYAPAFDVDGTILATPGHHRGVYVDLGDLTGPPIPDRVTCKHVEDAVSLLTGELLVDFPFCDEIGGKDVRDASEANALAMIVTRFMRRMIKGQVPVFMLGKPSPGAGATELVNTVGRLAEGRDVQTSGYSADDAEVSKGILSIAKTGGSDVFYDNLRGRFDSPTVLRFATSEVITGRPLGVTDWFSRPNDLNWYVTAISPRLSPEMARRTVSINLRADVASYRDRKFRHTDLKVWTLEKRGDLIAAILTMIKFWIQLGRPDYAGDVKFPSFGPWLNAVGGVLETAGVTGFMTNTKVARPDREAIGVHAFATALVERYGEGLIKEAQLLDWARGECLPIAADDDDGAFFDRLDGLLSQSWDIGGRLWTLRQTDGLWHMKPAAGTAS